MPDITSLFQGSDAVNRNLFNQKISDINAHGNDTTSHVTEKEREVWNKKANGNNAVWVATSVVMADNNQTYRLTIPNFVFTEGCQVTFLAPVAPALELGTSKWINIAINSLPVYRIRNSNKEELSGDEWTYNSMVTLTLSSQTTTVNGNVKSTAFFKGGSGSIKEMITFPLSIQTTEPTPLDTNHVWIQKDRKMSVVFDDTIRSWPPDDSYWFIQDNMDNSFIYLYSPMQTTDGTVISSTVQKTNRDTNPWKLSERGGTNGYGHAYGKKHGLDYYADIRSKWPRILSRINGVIDVENAKRWDGDAWQWLSQKGRLIYMGTNVYTDDGNYNLTKVTTIPYSAIALTTNGNTVLTAGSSSNQINVFKRNGLSYSTSQTITYPNSGTNYATTYSNISISDDGSYICIGGRSTSFGVSYDIYKLNTSGMYEKVQNIAFGTAYYGGAKISPNGKFIAVLERYNKKTDDGGYVKFSLYKYNSGTFVEDYSYQIDHGSSPSIGAANNYIAWSGNSKVVTCSEMNSNRAWNLGVTLNANDAISIQSGVAISSASGSLSSLALNYDGTEATATFYSSQMASPKYYIYYGKRDSNTVVWSNFSSGGIGTSGNNPQYHGWIKDKNVLLIYSKNDSLLHVYQKGSQIKTKNDLSANGQILSVF